MQRTALELCQDAAVKLGLDRPSVLFSSADRTDLELRRAMVEAADKIVHAHDWQLLKTIQTHLGDGTTTKYTLPTDFLRMPKDAQVWSTKWQRQLYHITPEDWLYFDVRDFNFTLGSWTVYGGDVIYEPALANDELAKFFYISDRCVAAEDGTPKSRFTADDDTFRLDDRLLELVLVWVWRAQKSLDYAEEQASAEVALARAIERDKGARILTQRGTATMDAKLAYPLSVSSD
jgi:hypothetical protein